MTNANTEIHGKSKKPLSLSSTELSAPTNPTNPVKIHLVIPARYQSSRLPGKPLLDIHGKPMILWVAHKASQASFIDDMCIATDDERIAQVCEQAGYEVVMTSADHPSGTDRLAEVAHQKGWSENDIVVNMQGDEPLVPAILLAQVTELLLAQPECVMATLSEPIHDVETFLRPSVVKVVKNQLGHAIYFSRAPIPCDRALALALAETAQPMDALNKHDMHYHHSAAPILAERHLGIYAYRVGLLRRFSSWQVGALENLECLEQLRILEHGEKIAIATAKTSLPAGVDTPEDLQRLQALPIEHFL